MLNNIFDTHSHYDDDKFDSDRFSLLSNAKNNGIFDYYMKSLRFIFIGVNSKKYSKQQKAKFNAMIKGYARIIPQLSVLKSNTHKVLYVMSKIHLDHITFLKTYDLIEKWRRL